MVIPLGAPPLDGINAKSNSGEALDGRVAELLAAVDARDTFIAVAAHELRNPMTPIIGQVELLLNAVRARRCQPEQVEAQLTRIQQTLRHFVKRASVLLDVSRINTGKLCLGPELFDAAAALRQVAEDFDAVAQRSGITLSVDLPETLPMTCDRMAFEQVVDNLVTNALKHGGRTPVELRAKLVGSRVRVCVSDHGPGIPLADRERVFDRFERVVNKGEQGSGFGVGLWVVNQLVEAMGGAIEIQDVPEGGTLFEVLLPQHAKGQGT